MLRWRLPLGILLVAALLVLCWLDLDGAPAGIWLFPLTAIVTVLATQETLRMTALAQLHPLRWPVYLGNLLIVCGTWLVFAASLGLNWLLPGTIDPQRFIERCLPGTPICCLAIAVVLIFVLEMRRYQKPGDNLANIAASIFPLVYVGAMLSFAVNLRITWGTGALASWIIVVKMGDTGAYIVGRLIGRHKLVPMLSPGKTVEGAIGDLLFCCLGSWIAFNWLIPLTVPETVAAGPWWGWIVFGILVGIAGMVGDLAESLLKRDVGRKDSSDWLPGLGGVLDIVDSLLLAAPVAWLCWASGLVGR